MLMEPDEITFSNPVIKTAVEETLRKKAEERHYVYTEIPPESQGYRFVALNEMGRMFVER